MPDPSAIVPSTVSLTDEDLLRLLTNFEDNFVERKTNKDTDGWLRTAVAFANTLQVGYPGVLFVGVDNAGNPQSNGDVEKLQKDISNQISRAFPPIYHLPRVLEKASQQFVGVIIPGSPERPHFTGKSYVRIGPQTCEASAEQFESLIAQRSSLVYELLKYRGKEVRLTMLEMTTSGFHERHRQAIVLDCNAFYASFTEPGTVAIPHAFPLSRVRLSYDHHGNRLDVIMPWQ
jgi:predicted HTH transcriptional regulator